jgi:hypothetical protein
MWLVGSIQCAREDWTMRALLVAMLGAALASGPSFAAEWEPPPLAGPPVAANPFLGGYAALGGAYGVGSPRTFSATSAFGGLGSDPGFFGNASPAGWSGVAVAGVNMTFGPALVGIELDGRAGEEKFTRDAAAANNSGLTPAGAIFYRYDFTNDGGVHLSGRLGAVLGDTLIFGKIGAGASRIRDGFAADQRAAFRCGSSAVIQVPNTFTFINTCIGPTVGGAGAFTQTRWVPSLLLGGGAERNFGAFFARGSVEAEMLTQDFFSITQPTTPAWSFTGSVSSPNSQWTVRANVLAGVRF